MSDAPAGHGGSRRLLASLGLFGKKPNTMTYNYDELAYAVSLYV